MARDSIVAFRRFLYFIKFIFTHEDPKLLKVFKPDAKIVKRFHPIYDNYGIKNDKKKTKKALKIQSKHVILFFGIIREYKGLDILIESINTLKNKLDNFHVLIVGECYEDVNIYISLISKYEINHLITFVNKYVSNEDIS